jgi:hypothetical protein
MHCCLQLHQLCGTQVDTFQRELPDAFAGGRKDGI